VQRPMGSGVGYAQTLLDAVRRGGGRELLWGVLLAGEEVLRVSGSRAGDAFHRVVAACVERSSETTSSIVMMRMMMKLKVCSD
jgi:hypothetical protein